MSIQDISGQFALDMQGIQRLKHSAGRDPEAGLPEASRQFEALFVQRMLKSMRDASPESELMNSQQTRFYTELLDQQLAQHLAGRGIGLAEQLIQQLGGTHAAVAPPDSRESLIAGIPRGTPRRLEGGLQGSSAEDSTQDFRQALDARQAAPAPTRTATADDSRAPEPVVAGDRPAHVQAFVTRLAEPARAASQATGVPAELILAQAALETGWGRHGIPRRDGGESHNLFGIKAGSHWQGATTEITTHEYLNGQRTRVVDTFRVYDSYADAFTDYARLIGSNPRYAGVLDAADGTQAAHALQRGGYATDPAYADKLIAVMDSLGPLSSSMPRMASDAPQHREATVDRLALARRLF